MSDSHRRIDLGQLRKQAKDLSHLARDPSGFAGALPRIRRHHPRFAHATVDEVRAEFSLQEAQHVIARERGYDSWPKLVATVEDRGASDRDGRFTSDELRGLEKLHESLAKHLQGIFRDAGDTDAETRVRFVDQVTWAEFLGSRADGSWSYSYTPKPLEGSAIFELPLQTADRLARLAEGRVSPSFYPCLLQLVSGTRAERDLAPGDHLRFIAPLLDNGLEASWLPVMQLDMADIEVEYDPEGPHRHVADPADVVALVALAMADDELALRACYPYQTLVPQLWPLAEHGRRTGI